MSQPVREKPSHRIIEFEGLRGCLAWWVVLFQLGLLSHIPESALTKAERMVALGGWQAVELFIILSGFVIALLLDVERELRRLHHPALLPAGPGLLRAAALRNRPCRSPGVIW
jgi:peptidoglycan/LPS O-acetylase OafA/YrhL